MVAVSVAVSGRGPRGGGRGRGGGPLRNRDALYLLPEPTLTVLLLPACLALALESRVDI